ncbi:MAG: STAS domain-containing protein [Pseudonocardia sp.]|uniref:STAS domain-containing protein n=1 Tax=unclassified Pseudonocardia TaxID=2619320 RepID=UPI000B264390|nr:MULTISPECIES: STAS domain-containing protein [unclassified Pseudonocardia]MBN9109209.1 STAS domain-containing protein [Pseudonocardia sp.]
MHASSASDPAPPSRADGPDQITVSVVRPEPGTVVVTVGGEVDMLTSPQLRSALVDHIGDDSVELVVVDLDGVTFLGTSGLAALIEVREAAHAAGVGLRLACTGRRVLRPLSIAGLLPMFDIHDSVDAALAPT